MIAYKSKRNEYAIKKITTNSGRSTYQVHQRHSPWSAMFKQVSGTLTYNTYDEARLVVDKLIKSDETIWNNSLAKEEWV